MTNRKNTSRALVASALAVLLCVSMLVGSTFAWFTDNATTQVNNIVSGTLDIKIVDEDGNEKTTALNFLNKDKSENILWEPGVTFKTEGFKLQNVGNLWLKYKIQINNTDTAYNMLNEVITFKVVGEDGNEVELNPTDDYTLEPKKETGMLYIEGHMDENAGNDYQGETMEGVSITVLATQHTQEWDSETNQYDAGAIYPVVSAKEAVEAMANAQPGDTIAIASNIGALSIPAAANGITVDASDAELTKISIEDGATDITLVGVDIENSDAAAFLIENVNNAKGTLTLKNCDLTAVAEKKSGRAISDGNSELNLVLDGCEIGDIGYGVYDAFHGYKSLTITNSTFNNIESWAIMTQGKISSFTVDNCTFIDCEDGIAKLSGMQADGTLVFTNNTLTNCKGHDGNPAKFFELKVNCDITCTGNTLDGAEFNPFN